MVGTDITAGPGWTKWVAQIWQGRKESQPLQGIGSVDLFIDCFYSVEL